jgi:hypothetical protein
MGIALVHYTLEVHGDSDVSERSGSTTASKIPRSGLTAYIDLQVISRGIIYFFAIVKKMSLLFIHDNFFCGNIHDNQYYNMFF